MNFDMAFGHPCILPLPVTNTRMIANCTQTLPNRLATVLLFNNGTTRDDILLTLESSLFDTFIDE